MTENEAHMHTEERIFEAALRVFSVKGKGGARMQEIADEAGINKAMLHYYFRSKDRLYESVFKHVLRRYSEIQVKAITEAPTFAETLRSFISGFIDINKNDPSIIRLMVNENLAGGATMGRIINSNEHQDSPPVIMLRKIEEAAARGEIRRVDPEHTLLTILSCCLFFFIWAPTIKIKIRQSNDWDRFVEARKNHIFEMLYFGLVKTENEP